MSYNFDFCLSVGATAEELVKEHLAARGHKITDVTQDKDYQTKDIDFLLDNGNEKTTLEVKSDSKISRNGNFFSIIPNMTTMMPLKFPGLLIFPKIMME